MRPFRIQRELDAPAPLQVFEAAQCFRAGAVRNCYLKVARDGPERERFMVDVQLVRALDHPNIARPIRVGTTQNHLYLAVERDSGISLEKALDRPCGLKPLTIAQQIALALAHIHGFEGFPNPAEPLAMLCLSPAEVVLRPIGVGLRNLWTGSYKPPLWESLPYAAPEQLAGATGTFKSDMYSLGVMLLEMLRGGRVPIQILRSSSDLSRLLRGLERREGETLAGIVRSLLLEDPKKRPGSASQLASALGAVRREPSRRPTVHALAG